MTDYRLQFLKFGRVIRTHDFRASDDTEAIKFAAVWIEAAPMELCCGDRLVKRWTLVGEDISP